MKHQPHHSEAIPPAALAVLAAEPSEKPTDAEREALERLIRIAKADTDQSRRVADFLLAWWNSGSCGSFDLTVLWGVDDAIAADMTTVFAFIARVRKYPDKLGYGSDFAAIVRAWRPELVG